MSTGRPRSSNDARAQCGLCDGPRGSHRPSCPWFGEPAASALPSGHVVCRACGFFDGSHDLMCQWRKEEP